MGLGSGHQWAAQSSPQLSVPWQGLVSGPQNQPGSGGFISGQKVGSLGPSRLHTGGSALAEDHHPYQEEGTVPGCSCHRRHQVLGSLGWVGHGQVPSAPLAGLLKTQGQPGTPPHRARQLRPMVPACPACPPPPGRPQAVHRDQLPGSPSPPPHGPPWPRGGGSVSHPLLFICPDIFTNGRVLWVPH